MTAMYLLGASVDLKDPLAGEPRGPWKVVGINTNAAPIVYKLMRLVRKGVPPKIIHADEGELTKAVAALLRIRSAEQ